MNPFSGRTASFRIRDIHPSHYGRICPIDTSEGINVGLIGSLAIHARIGHWGSLESPFYEISERSTGDIQEDQVVPARYRQEFLTIAWEQVHLRSIFPFLYPSRSEKNQEKKKESEWIDRFLETNER
nr:RNA polymerase beta subunit [Ipomoea batatas]